MQVITNGKSSHLRKSTIEIHHSANFIKPNTKSVKDCQWEVAKSQVGFVATLRVGNKVHLCKGNTGCIEVGTVKEINDLTLTLVEVMGLRNLSEIQTIDFSDMPSL